MSHDDRFFPSLDTLTGPIHEDDDDDDGPAPAAVVRVVPPRPAPPIPSSDAFPDLLSATPAEADGSAAAPAAPAAPAGSWASRLRAVQDAPKKVVVKETIIAKEIVSEEAAAAAATSGVVDPLNAEHRTVRLSLPPSVKGVMVLDTNVFIKGFDDLLTLADVFVTVPQVLQEVKDVAARDLLERLPIKLTVLDPSLATIQKVMDKAAQTGDVGAMSRTDIRVCALAYECCVQLGCLAAEIEPRGTRINPAEAAKGGSGVETVTEEVDEEDEESDDDDDDQPARVLDVDDWGDDDDAGEWITPANVAKQREKDAVGTVAFAAHTCACVTSDFPMQNTLLHLGVPVLGPQGRVIKELRQWLLRCHACFELVHDTARQFCPACGSGDTLKRVSYVVDSDGTKKLFINFSKRIAVRGTIFNLPKPRGGRRGTNRTLALREDQLAKCGRAAAELKERRVARDDELAVFGESAKAPARFNPNGQRVYSSYKRGNVNERKKAAAARRK